MQTKIPLLRQETNWLALIPRILLTVILCLFFHQFDKRNFFFYGFLLYLTITIPLKRILLPASSYKGVKLLKEGNFKEAIPFIQNDIDYFTKRPWIDHYAKNEIRS